MAETSMNPRLNEINGQGIAPTRTTNPQDSLALLLDRDWVKRSFMVSDAQLEDSTNIKNRYFSSADFKFVDTKLGRSFAINARPQFTPYSDIRRRGRLASRKPVSPISTTGDHGLGRYYSEAIDDPSQNVYMRFGVPEHTSILDFLTRAFDPEALHLAKTGRVKGALFTVGRAIGGYVGIVSFPQVAAIMFIGKIANTIFSKPRYKYYTLKPTMHNYWSAVNLLVNSMAANLRILPLTLSPDTQIIGKPFKVDEETVSAMEELMPNVIRDGYIDMFAVANQAQLIANKVFLEEYDKLDSSTQYNYDGYLKKGDGGSVNNRLMSNGILGIDKSTNKSLPAFINDITMVSEWFKSDEDAEKSSKTELSPTIDPETGKFSEERAKDTSKKATYTDYLDAEFRSGSQFAVFKVNYTSGISESFTNSVKESEISQKLNQTVSQIRDLTFSAGDFKLPGAAGEAAGAVASGVGDVLSGALSGVTFGLSDALTSILSGTYVDIPKHWQSSDASLAKANYSMTLISPYGNPYSLLHNIYIPLAMLMASALPMAGGKGSYTSPFICELYDRGKIQIRLGMVESLTITRGTSNLGFSVNNKPLAIDVSMSVIDLSSIMSMPIAPAGIKDAVASVAGAAGAAVGGVLGTYNPAIDEDSLLYDYLAVLTGLDIYSQIYPVPKAILNTAKAMIKAKTLTSPAAWAMLTNESATSGVLKYTPVGWFQFLVDGTIPPGSLTEQSKS